ncbi:alanine/glycine:cation symporter family protein [Salinicoccus halodurans]|uniref:Alanine or glycine:cation symporter, AGCS family n=1 Tax=Salinicoccus halodurans TaxID=407035 RepID=A0A0F7D4F8_9STAP|nr:alanine/glycine:cation symporter family protein [Salinicoccus halodurans]AKG74160.1 sodium:alanine symporter [Salinicoccus halodurans]SFK61310.1 alanine or glycine:cation symporter, AGCS family [Salinicoccus halodurans]
MDFEGIIPDWFKTIVEVGNTLLWGDFLIGLLILAGLYFSISSRFVQFRWFREMFYVLKEKAEILPDGSKGISPFKAFTISAASRVGTGNIAGVATAIVLGGPGAVFWMWVIAFFGAATAFFESTLAQVFKVKDREGGFRGGPAYYMEKGLNQRWLGIFFAVLITVTFGFVFNGLQSNTIAHAYEEAFNIDRWVIGLIVAALTAVVIFGGAKWVANVTGYIVPVMAVIYLSVVLVVLIINYDQIIPMISTIFANAFGLREAFGGAVGAAILNGFQRGLFSNEAGMGSAPNAAAAAAVSHPVKQGLIQSLGVFFDTMVVCTATAVIILMYTDLEYGADALQGIQVTQAAMTSQIGSFGATFIAIVILLFAYSSILGNFFYGQSNLNYIKENKGVLFIFKALVVVMVFVGAVMDLETAWATADMFMALMAVTNLVAVFALSSIVFQVAADYRTQLKQGINPVFQPNNIKADLSDVDEWGENRYTYRDIDRSK